MTYEIQFTPAARRDLKKLQKPIQTRIHAELSRLAENPYHPGTKKLKDAKLDLFRVRVGDYRVIYQIDGGHLVVLIIRIRDRKEVYGKG